MGSTINRLKRELAASPKKAATLGLLLLVGLYYWAPLAYRWIAPTKPSLKTNAVAGQTTPAASPNTAAAAKSDQATTFSWQQLAKAISTDARMSSVAAIAIDRDPFAIAPRVVAAESAPATVKEQPVIGPEDVNLVLSSTIVGSRRSIAIINGKTFRPGDTIKASTEDEEVAFHILEIYGRHVVLEREGHKFELKIPVKLAASDVLGTPAPQSLDGAGKTDEPEDHPSDGSRDSAPPVRSQPN